MRKTGRRDQRHENDQHDPGMEHFEAIVNMGWSAEELRTYVQEVQERVRKLGGTGKLYATALKNLEAGKVQS